MDMDLGTRFLPTKAWGFLMILVIIFFFMHSCISVFAMKRTY